jgi:hypothetical protein
MAHVFLSHSSKDKDFVRQLHADLKAIGHQPWLDEWEIKVGECIVTKVERALADADFVVVVMSPNSVASGWVDREWKAKYWNEITEKKITVLPLMLADCPVPLLLQTRRYADFRTNPSVGFMNLVSAIGVPIVVPAPPPAAGVTPNGEAKEDKELVELIAKAQDHGQPLATCIAGALKLAIARGNLSLREFCERELGGYEGHDDDYALDSPKFPHHRLIQTFHSATATINPSYFGWGKSFSSAFAYMQQDTENFSQTKTLIGKSISALEASVRQRGDAQNGMLHWTRKHGDLVPGSKYPEHPVHFYAAGDAYSGMLDAIRSELTKRLLAMLPAGSPPTE